LAILCSIISYYHNINLSNVSSSVELNSYLTNLGISAKSGGAVSDLVTHWKYIELLRDDLSNLLKLELGKDFGLLNYPLHHIIFSQIPIINSNIKTYLLFFFIISLFLPILFYKCLKIRFGNIDKTNLFNLASILYILPSFQYSAIWGSPHITAIFFVLASIYNFLKFQTSVDKNKKNLFYGLFFLTLASYTKQYYIFLFPFYLLILLEKLSVKELYKIFVFLIVLSIPGIFFLTKNPLLFIGYNTLDITNFPSSVLISISIYFFYLLPIFLVYILSNQNSLNDFVKFFENIYIIPILLFFIVATYFFFYAETVGGGIILKFSNIFLGNNVIFFISAYLGTFIILFYVKDRKNLILCILMISIFSTGFFVFQKYFEIMFFFLFYLFFNKEKIQISIEKNIYIISYFVIYYFSINLIYKTNYIY